ncbi:WSC domain-containing protein [Colletotrichum siamense]|uniref:WSC domain-containing protein n=1 Tax=Colletotrichum siamense TaxID=690259 RepID=UPI0018730B8D|nr:WSC domain-containing protein [Colletotrichum siamense]KAF5484710.1 WSC domain-containing protein [Colletotrichum siamense]
MDSSHRSSPAPNYSQPHDSDGAYVENGLHPVEQTDKIVNNSHYVSYDQYKPVPLSADQGYVAPIDASRPTKKRICGISSGVFILLCLLAFFIAILVVVAGVFGSMLAKQSAEVLDLKSTSPTKTSDPDANGSSTATAAAATTTWVTVTDWDFIGCYEDGDERVFSGNISVIQNQTNKLCALACDGFDYFGTQYGDQCYCSKTPPKTAAPAWNCDMHCAGAPNSEICGGYYFLSAWKKKSS